MNWRLPILTVVSGVVCLTVLVVLLISYQLDVERHGIAVTSGFHVGFFRGGVWFYGNELPYMGSIIQISSAGAPGSGYPPLLDEAGVDFPGVYYRFFRFRSSTIWTLMVSLWYPVGLFVLLPVVWFFRNLKLRRGP